MPPLTKFTVPLKNPELPGVSVDERVTASPLAELSGESWSAEIDSVVVEVDGATAMVRTADCEAA